MEGLYKILGEINSTLPDNRPIKIKINEEWLKSQIDDGLIRKEESFGRESAIFGLPVEFSETIETYRLVYDDPYEEIRDMLEKMYGHKLDKFEREMIISNIRVSESMKDDLYNLTRLKSYKGWYKDQ